ncbi:hypothetical protein PV10_00213 [Exophiala mesophila]|uniref:Uncharacterized protein n=1 Tax=Exophiala mesophila TaxID=212818 RepID=A0A0D1ZNW6_EXOME|nr:uncharacterized protein PV10_00213 [Exophiala mesophila]KIV96332.1 hypothetical protein PV10_00213 [Exophiala mesophila]
MGIKGLLGLIKSIQKHSNLKHFSGQTLGIDAYGWLHRGVTGCAFALASGKPTTIHIDFVLSRVRMLLDFGVVPYLVFDGDDLPSKAGTNLERQKRRQDAKTKGMELQKAGKTSLAHQEFSKAVDVTPLMARQLINELKKLNVQYIVAPYEADAQLVYLEQKGIIDGILSEDSDLLVFGAKRLLTKLNQYGELVEINRSELPVCKEVSFAGWTDTMFRQMAILSGCDYLPNIGKIGLKTAHAHIRRHKSVDKVIKVIKFEGKHVVPEDYSQNFRNAELTFLHHRVFCPLQKRMMHLNELGPGLKDSDLPFLGAYVEPDIAIGVACGDLDPFSKKPIHLDTHKAGRPVLADARRQSYASDPGMKIGKSIETFFKPHRQPLAELDPNSLTPSPSQQRLLDRNRNASWEPRLASSAPPLNRTVTAFSDTSRQQSVSREDQTIFVARASALSNYKAPKRQRLCAELTACSPSLGIDESPFFKTGGDHASPLAQKKKRDKKGRHSSFEVFSDESIPDHLLVEAELDRLVRDAVGDKETPTHASAQEGKAAIVESTPQKLPMPASPLPSHVLEQQSPLPPSPVLVDPDKDPDAFHDLLEFHVRKQNASLLRTFAFQPEEQRASALKFLAPRQGRDELFSALSSESQRDALGTLPKSPRVDDFCDIVKSCTTFGDQPAAIQRAALKTLGASNKSVKECGPPVEAEEETPSISPRPEVRVSGSEDALIPNSEDELSDRGSPIRNRKLDLSSYIYAP